MNPNEAVFYIHDDDSDDDDDVDDDDEELSDKDEELSDKDEEALEAVEKAAHASRRSEAQRHVSKKALARQVVRLQERCSALEAAVQSSAAQRDATVAKLNWLEHMVRALASVSSRTNPVYWNLAKREALPNDFDHAPLASVVRPRSQYEHAPRRDHAFNRQPLPPPPPPLHLNDLPRDAYNRVGGRYDSASLLARVGAFLSESDRLLSRISSRMDGHAAADDDNDSDDRGNNGNDDAVDDAITPRAAKAPSPASAELAALAAPTAAAAAAAAAGQLTQPASLTAAEAAVAVARERERVRSGNIDEAAQMSRDLNKLLGKKRGGARE